MCTCITIDEHLFFKKTHHKRMEHVNKTSDFTYIIVEVRGVFVVWYFVSDLFFSSGVPVLKPIYRIEETGV